MALLAAPVSAPAEEPWPRACAEAGLDVHLLRATGGDAAGLERGLEELVGASEQRGCVWVAQLSGAADAVAYAGAVLGVAAVGGTVVLGTVAAAMSALVDACAGEGLRVVLAQCAADAAEDVRAAFVRGDMAAGLGSARIALLRDGGASWAVLGWRRGVERSALWRVAVPGPSMPLPGAAAVRGGSLPVWLRRAPEDAPRLRRLPPGVAAALALLLIVAVSVGGAGWVITHRGTGSAAPLGPISWNGAGLSVPSPRVQPMAATWDRTGAVILFGGADPGSGHGLPLGDTWRGALPPASAWQPAGGDAAPTPRLAGAVASDPVDGYVLLFGGEGPGDTGLSDTWTYAGGWSQLQPAHSPPPGPALAATEPGTGRVVLVTACCALGAVPTAERMQTWRWTGADWSLLGPSPGWVTTAAIVADGWDGTVVMLAAGGGSGSGFTYVWDGSAWSSRGGAAPPVPAGVRPQLTYDPRSRLVLDVVPAAGGTHDTWAWDGRAWTRAETGGGPPVVGLVLAEPAGGHALLYGGTAEADELTQRWFWAGSEWAETIRPPAVAAQPSASFGAAVAADPGTGGLVLSGGAGASGETWVWSGHDWTQAFFTTPAPLPRQGAAMAYDPVSHRTLLLGGRLDDGATTDDMWAWQGSSWVPLRPTSLPPPGDAAVLAWDPSRGVALLVVPDGAEPLPSAQTWTWDGTAWTWRAPAEEPPLRAGSSLAFDPVTGGMLLVTPCCPASTTQRSETWLWDGAAWHRLDPLHDPPLHAFVATDAARGRVLLVAACCAGFDGDTVGPPQTWVWDGADWTRLSASLPALQDVAALADDASGTPLLVGRLAGAGPGHPLDGVWRWTGADWVRLF